MRDHSTHPAQSPRPVTHNRDRRPVITAIVDSDVQSVTDSEVQKIQSLAETREDISNSDVQVVTET